MEVSVNDSNRNAKCENAEHPRSVGQHQTIQQTGARNPSRKRKGEGVGEMLVDVMSALLPKLTKNIDPQL